MMTREEARKASYERGVAQATQDITNWITNSERRNDMFAQMAKDRVPLHMWRVRFQLWMVRHIGNHLGLYGTSFPSADYDERRVFIADWCGDTMALAHQRMGAKWTYEHDDAYGAMQDILNTGIWLADDGDKQVSTLMDAYMLTLDVVDWAHVRDYYNETSD